MTSSAAATAGAPRTPDAPLAPPAPSGGLLDVFKRRYVLKLLVKRELSARYQGSFLGLLWSYVQPGVRFLMYYFVVGMVLGLDRGIEYFGIHLFAGMVVVHYFTETFTAGTRSIVRNRAIVKKMAMPREMFPVASMLVSAYYILSRDEPYAELGADWLARRNDQAHTRRLVAQLERLGHTVLLDPIA